MLEKLKKTKEAKRRKLEATCTATSTGIATSTGTYRSCKKVFRFLALEFYSQTLTRACALETYIRTDITIIGDRAKRARHCQVCSIENHGYIYTRNVLLSAQMGERASVVLICIITSRYNEVK